VTSKKDFGDVPTEIQPSGPAPSAASDFALVIIDGPDAGGTLRLPATAAQAVRAGSSSGCDLRLSDRQTSRRHLAIEPLGSHLRITDLGSTNGTFVNGVAVIEGLLFGGEVVRLGATSIRVDRLHDAGVPTLPRRSGFGRLVGASEAMARLYPLCEKLATSTITAILEGETGTGKEVLAEALHEEGPRADRPFVVFDCTAIPSSLVESELFGHERGAFTGAVAARKGVLEQAHGGTLLIDEIGDLDPSLQPKLLRAIDRAEIRRLGGDKVIQVDVRILCATRRDLDREVQAGRFRDDLLHRLAIARIELPPLRKRKGDVGLLARHIAARSGADPGLLPPALLARWDDYAWPGNVRELRNTVLRYLALGELAMPGPPERAADAALPADGAPDAASDFIDRVIAKRLPLGAARESVVEEFESRYLAALDAAHDNERARAAEAAVAIRHLQRLRARAPR
jgi:transcriptional regulator with GAF, ATPase, and Fis domain